MEGSERETSGGGMLEDLKALPDDIRAVGQEADDRLGESVQHSARFEYMLDLKTVFVAVAVALIAALILRLMGVPALIGIVIVVAILGIAIFAVAEFRKQPLSREERAQLREKQKAETT